MIFFNHINTLYNEKTYAHPFNRNQASLFMAHIYQMQIESELVLRNLVNENVTLAQNHANKAASLLTPGLVIEIVEGNAQTSRDLAAALNNLTLVSSSSESQKQIVSNLVSDINVSLTEAVNFRIPQALTEKPPISLEKDADVIGLFGSTDQGGDNYQADENFSVQPLVFTELVDRVLVNYGNAYGVEIDMTNMSNMVMPMNTTTDVNNSSHGNMNMDSMNMSFSTPANNANRNNRNYSLVNITDYQSAQALATKALEIFDSKLKHIATNNTNKSNQSIFVTSLESGISQLNNSIGNKASPLDIMMIVHTQIHPNLLEIFDLEIRKN
jgi:hypothetical protein